MEAAEGFVALYSLLTLCIFSFRQIVLFDVCLMQVVFLGNGRCGKTSLLRTIAKEPLQLDQKSTRGVSVDGVQNLQPNFFDRVIDGVKLDLSFWDFAGQLEYSAAHDFFLSARQAVYVVVYSVLDDDESIMQQLLYWLSVIPQPGSPFVRLMIVGTKIDMVPSGHLQAVMQMKRGIILQVIEAKSLIGNVQESDILFVTALGSFSFKDPLLSMNWNSCRSALKTRLYDNCEDIFKGSHQELRYPKSFRDMSAQVSKLREEFRRLHNQQNFLPCCRLDDPVAVSIFSSICKSKDQSKNYFKMEVVMDALNVLNDLGIIFLYGHENQAVPDIAPNVPSICFEPQFLPGIMSLLVDPQTVLPAVTTVDDLMQLLERNPDISGISRSNPQREQMLQLLVSAGIVRRYDHGQKLLVPLALRGRPVCWSQIIRGRVSAMMLGQRLGMSPNVTVSAALFIKVMLEKCVDVDRMWGCAFAYDLSARGEGICIFVRLRENRGSVDVVAVMNGGVDCEAVFQQEVDSIARFLGKGFIDASERMRLCPMCCSADMFVRSGAVHAFHMKEVAAGGALRCSRYHDVTASHVIRGKLTKLDIDSLPFVYPSRLHELNLPWMSVESGGIINSSKHSSMFRERKHSVLDDGTFTAMSFFVLTGQVSAGDCIASKSLSNFNRHLSLCESQDCMCEIFLTNGQCTTLHFSFNLGQSIPNSFFDTPIARIFPANIGDRAQFLQASLLQRFCAHDNVLVLFGPLQKGTKFLVFPGSSVNLRLCRLTPALCLTDQTAASCWSELQVRCVVVFTY